MLWVEEYKNDEVELVLLVPLAKEVTKIIELFKELTDGLPKRLFEELSETVAKILKFIKIYL